MVEINSRSKYTLEEFEIEFNNGNFINGERVKPYKQFIIEYYQKLEKESRKEVITV